MRRTYDLPPELDKLVLEEKKKMVHSGNASSVVRLALINFFGCEHTRECASEAGMVK